MDDLGNRCVDIRSLVDWEGDVLVISGGGQLDDAWGGASAHPYALWKWCVLARIRRKRVYFISVGAGPISSKRSEFLLRMALRLAHYRSFRNTRSRDLVRRQLKIENPGAVVPDLAHSVGRIRSGAPEADASLRIIGVGVMPHCDPRMSPWPGPDPERFERYTSKITAFVRWAVEEFQATVVLYVGEVTHDCWVIEDILDKLMVLGVEHKIATAALSKD